MPSNVKDWTWWLWLIWFFAFVLPLLINLLLQPYISEKYYDKRRIKDFIYESKKIKDSNVAKSDKKIVQIILQTEDSFIKIIRTLKKIKSERRGKK